MAKKKVASKAKASLNFSERELSKMNLNDLELDNAKLSHELQQSKLKELLLEHKLMDAKIERQRLRVSEHDKSRAAVLSARQGFVKLMTEKHNLTPGWGYHPDSGQIILKE